MIGFRRCREFDISGKLKTLSALNPRRHQRGGFFAALAPTPTSTVTESVVGFAATRVSREASGSEGAALSRRRIRWRNFRHVPTFSRHQIQDAGRNYGTGDAPRWGSR